MDEQAGDSNGRRLRTRRWRTALVWAAALAALGVAAWIATLATYDVMNG
jgi:hypothetical protein